MSLEGYAHSLLAILIVRGVAVEGQSWKENPHLMWTQGWPAQLSLDSV